MISPVFTGLAAVAGSVGGSFAVTAGLRAVRGEAFFEGRSHCDHCATFLGFAQTLPVWSFLARRGRCAVCAGQIDPWHIAGEVTGLVIGGLCSFLPPGPAALAVAFLGLVLFAASVIDAKTQTLSDGLTLAAAVLALLLSGLRGRDALVEGVMASLVCALVLSLSAFGMRRMLGRPALGFGDVKLASALALWVGVQTPLALGLASLAALVAVRRLRPADGRIAFGPFIASACWIVGFASEVSPWRA